MNHYMSGHPAHSSWRGARERCNNPNHVSYASYGGRGIKMCGRWDSFLNFWEDMSPTYMSGYTLERVDNNGDYEPANCMWVTRGTQSRNQRSNLMVYHCGGSMILKDACALQGVSYPLLKHRFHIFKRTSEDTPTLQDLLQMNFAGKSNPNRKPKA